MYRYKLIAPGMAGWSGSQGCPAKKFNFVSSLVTSFIIGNSGISKVDVTGAYNVIRVIGGTQFVNTTCKSQMVAVRYACGYRPRVILWRSLNILEYGPSLSDPCMSG